MNRISMYQTHQTSSDVDNMVKKYSPIVKKIAYHMINRLPRHVEIDDIIQAGMMGLLDAYKQYDDTKGASFETYAGIRVRGAILDDVRKNDWFPRSVYRNARMISEAMRMVENRVKRNAKDHEIAETLEMNLEDYQKLLADVNVGQLYSLEDYGLDNEPLQPSSGDDDDPFTQVENKEFYEKLAQKIEQLPERERMVMSLYYDQELNLKEIGQVLEVSESRVCQIHSQAQLRLRSKLSDWKD